MRSRNQRATRTHDTLDAVETQLYAEPALSRTHAPAPGATIGATALVAHGQDLAERWTNMHRTERSPGETTMCDTPAAMPCTRRALLAAAPAALAAAGALADDRAHAATGAPPTHGLRLLFSGARDTVDPWGRLAFGTTPLSVLRTCPGPGFSVAHCEPGAGGAWDVWGQEFHEDTRSGFYDRKTVWRIIRATTRDGVTFEDRRTVLEGEPGCWTDHLGIAYNPRAGEFLALKLRYSRDGFGYTAYFSADGDRWREHTGNPLFHDCDSLGLFWSPVARRFICSCKSLQSVRKHFVDHGGHHRAPNGADLQDRRVLCIRSSPDGRRWTPAGSLVDVWDNSHRNQNMPTALLTVPDALDPPDMEFYRGIGFWHHDRAYMMVLNYAGSPLSPRKHGPQLDTEWWVSRDGLQWDRPDRDTNALGDAFPRSPCIAHNPMIIGGMMLFHLGGVIAGMKQDRLTWVGSRANAEFSTAAFTMPDAGLLLNAAIPAPDRPFASDQAYVMAGIVDAHGRTVPGYEPERCVLRSGDAIDLPLRWDGRSARALAGRTVRLRVGMRSARIYAVTEGNGSIGG